MPRSKIRAQCVRECARASKRRETPQMLSKSSPGKSSVSTLISLFKKTQFCSDSSKITNDSSVSTPLWKLIQTQCKSLEQVLGFFDSIVQMRPLPSITYFNYLLASLSKMDHHSTVVSLYRELMHLGCFRFQPNLRTFILVIKSICRLKNVDMGFSVFAIIFKRGLKPNERILNTLLHGLSLRGSVDEAAELFLEIIEKEHPIDGITFATMINGFCKAGETCNALELLKHMHEHDHDGVKLSACCYTPIICTIWKEGRIDEAFGLFEDMINRDVRADIFVCNTLLHGLCKSSRWNEAEKFLQVMNDWELSPNIVSFNIMLDSLFKEERTEEVLDIMERCKRGHKPDLMAYSSSVCRFFQLGQWKKAIDLLDELENEAISANVVTFTIIMHALFKQKRREEALAVHHLMVERGVLPNLVTYSVLIYGLCHLGQWKEAKMLMDEMVSRKIYPHIIAMNGILDAFCENQMMLRAQELFNMMTRHGPKPDKISYNTLIKGYCLQGEVDKAKKVLDQMRSTGIVPDIFCYNTLAIGYVKVNKIVDALELLKGVIEKGLAPNHVTEYTLKSIYARRFVSSSNDTA